MIRQDDFRGDNYKNKTNPKGNQGKEEEEDLKKKCF